MLGSLNTIIFSGLMPVNTKTKHNNPKPCLKKLDCDKFVRVNFTGNQDLPVEQRLNKLFEDFKKAGNGSFYRDFNWLCDATLKDYPEYLEKPTICNHFTMIGHYPEKAGNAAKIRAEGRLKTKKAIENYHPLNLGFAIYVGSGKSSYKDETTFDAELLTNKIGFMEFYTHRRFRDCLKALIDDYKNKHAKDLSEDECSALHNLLISENFKNKYDVVCLGDREGLGEIAVYKEDAIKLILD